MGVYERLSEPSVEPVSLAEMKNYLRVEAGEDDAFIADLITTARVWVEKTCGCCLITQAWRGLFHANGADVSFREGRVRMALERKPVRSVQAVATVFEDGSVRVSEPSAYQVDVWSEPALLYADETVLSGALRAFLPFRVDFTAGYGDAAADVPLPFRIAMMQLVAFWYAQRGDLAHARSLDAPDAVYGILAPFMNPKIRGR